MANVLQLYTFRGTNDGDLVLAPGYYYDGDRGGGWFVWSANLAASQGMAYHDMGRWIAPWGNISSSGRWVRVLKGEVANVKMWGARGDGTAQDWDAIQRAINACSFGLGGSTGGGEWVKEVLFPCGSYIVTNTIVFPACLHLHGEGLSGNTFIRMPPGVNKDIFRTQNADLALGGYYNVGMFDHGLLFENFRIAFEGDESTRNTQNAALVVYKPGEGHTIRNLNIDNGAFGIRSLGVGGPGLKLINVSTHCAAMAGISIEGWEGSHVGPVSLFGISGDYGWASYATTAALVRFVDCCPVASIYDLKAEGHWGGGLVQVSNSIAVNWPAGSVTIHGGTYDANGGTNVPCDIVVLKRGSGTQQSASVSILPMWFSGVKYLIRDEVTGRNVLPATGWMSTKVPVSYESCLQAADLCNQTNRSRLLIGQNAIYSFEPPAAGWYRIMVTAHGHSQLGGKLVISSARESAELHISVNPYGGGGGGRSWMNVARSTKGGGDPLPVVTKARCGYFQDPASGTFSEFVDVYVENLITSSAVPHAVTFTHEISGFESLYDGSIQLLTPTQPLPAGSPCPPGMINTNWVDSSLVR